MAIKIIGHSVFMEFEHLAKSDKDANKFIKNVTSINRQLTLEANPKPELTKSRLRPPFRWMSGAGYKRQNPKLNEWREANKPYRLTITIERV